MTITTYEYMEIIRTCKKYATIWYGVLCEETDCSPYQICINEILNAILEKEEDYI